MRFYWRDYIAAQTSLAEILMEKADALVGFDPVQLQQITLSRLTDVSRLTLAPEAE